jgi:hypothetical protein
MFRLESMSDLFADSPSPIWLVQDLFAERQLVGLSAPPGDGKTFVSLDIALHMGMRLPWHGRPAAGNVLYISAEGRAGFSRRSRAWAEHHETAPERFDGRFYAIRQPVAATIAEELQAVHNEIVALGFKPDLVVIDTKSACAGADHDENDTKDTEAFNNGTRAMRDNWECSVMTLTHPPKNGTGFRGSGALLGALDVGLTIEREGDTRTLKMVKCRDAELMEPFRFTLKQYGESAVVVPVEGVRGINSQTGEMLPSARNALATLVESGMGMPLTNQRWFILSGLQRTAYYGAKKALLAGGYVLQDGKGFVPTNKADQLLRLAENSSRTVLRTPYSSSSAPPYKGGGANELNTEVRELRNGVRASQRAQGPGLEPYEWPPIEAAS